MLNDGRLAGASQQKEKNSTRTAAMITRRKVL
jgi:hypothetical protein